MGSVSSSVARKRRQRRVRKKVLGTSERPRLCVFRSSRHIYAQIIDDSTGSVLAQASTVSKDLREKLPLPKGNVGEAALIGSEIAQRALERGIRSVVFDRNGFLYHGRVKALSEAARGQGLEF
ncbi:50S ribosomal subunit protein L18 [uncultured Desulfatiglans sp.]|nr:50S ribosomal subunit protein L18 [uncultured Desulfatiglans sp.]